MPIEIRDFWFFPHDDQAFIKDLGCISRVDKASWMHGDMVYVAMTGMTHSRLGIDWTPLREVFMVGSWAALGLEALAPVLLWVPGLGVVWALGLVAMHLSLELLTNVGHWSHVMIAGLMAFILPWRWRRSRS